MKAKFAKQHKLEIELEETEDEWGDTDIIIEGKHYKSKAAAKKAIDELITTEFNSRYLKDKK